LPVINLSIEIHFHPILVSDVITPVSREVELGESRPAQEMVVGLYLKNKLTVEENAYGPSFSGDEDGRISVQGHLGKSAKPSL
jgi:hypothetical protein